MSDCTGWYVNRLLSLGVLRTVYLHLKRFLPFNFYSTGTHVVVLGIYVKRSLDKQRDSLSAVHL